MNLFIWVLLTLPPNPAEAKVLETFKTEEECVQAMVVESFRNRDTTCRSIDVMAPPVRASKRKGKQ